MAKQKPFPANMVKQTVSVDEDLWHKFKKHTKRKGLLLSSAFTRLLLAELKEPRL